MVEIFYKIRMFGSRSGIRRAISFIVGLFLAIQVFYILNDWVSSLGYKSIIGAYIQQARDWLSGYSLICIPGSIFGKLGLIIILVLFFKSGRNLLFFILKKAWSFLGVIPGPKSKELADRYLNLARFALYHDQSDVFTRLKNQYPEGTGFVVLPMDMEYMEAGELKEGFRYADQMKNLQTVKKNNKDIFFPFVFVDPRRVVEEGNAHLKYKINDGKVILEDCFIQKYIEKNKFSGFKIYPALGYYPFDEALLPLWKYAADNELPIMTHCIKGTIFFRGDKKKEWDKHPVFEQATGEEKYKPLLLLETKNIDFCGNFTHPMNYLCLLDERLLRKLVGKSKDEKIRTLFGYNGPDHKMKYNLSHLKLCFGHFGGDDQWNRFLESDRDNYASQLIKQPLKGITFLENEKGEPTPGKPEQIWKFVDWYSIICSLMLQYPHVYADLSYIIHSPGIQPLLKHTLMNEKLKTKVLFGTDFYVVRNHKSEKNMVADMVDHLTEEEFDLIARVSPGVFLGNRIH